MTKKLATKTDMPAAYECSPSELRTIEAFQARRRKAKPLPEQVIERNGLKVSHPDQAVGATLTMEAFGLTRVPELTALLHHVADLTQKDRKADEYGINQMLAQIAAIEPRDGIEAMLATQMAVVHNAMMKSARSLRGSDTIPQQDSNGNLVNKLARTFADSRPDLMDRVIVVFDVPVSLAACPSVNMGRSPSASQGHPKGRAVHHAESPVTVALNRFLDNYVRARERVASVPSRQPAYKMPCADHEDFIRRVWPHRSPTCASWLSRAKPRLEGENV